MNLQVTINVNQQEQKDILIATLSDSGFTGFEEGENNLVGYVEEEKFEEEEFKLLLNNYSLSYSTNVIESKNWNELWESSFSPVVVDNFCIIRADFHSPNKEAEHEIIITPKMSFGTGHHATTLLMIKEMQYLNFKEKQVADFGTGTGILSILAEKLGCQYVWAIDNDDWSIDNAQENFERNNCNKIQVEKRNAFDPTTKFDIILANINRNVILENFTSLVFGLQPEGHLLLSGLLKEDEEIILKAAKTNKLVYIKTQEKDKWVSLLFTI